MEKLLLLMFAAGIAAGPGTGSARARKNGKKITEMLVSSPAFREGEPIPPYFTCDGEGVNPQLTIDHIPAGTRSFVLLVTDPDAPGEAFLHWNVYDMEPRSTIEENSHPGKEGITSDGHTKYVPPCPPSGTHRYYFTVYALDVMTGLERRADLGTLEEAMEGHVLARASLMGTCSRKKKRS